MLDMIFEWYALLASSRQDRINQIPQYTHYDY